MIILALDSSGPSAGAAILCDGQLIYESSVTNKLTHSANLMPMVQEALLRTSLDIFQVDIYAAVVGPGSFTGVRIAVAAVQGMALATCKRCIAVNALEALSLGVSPQDSVICPIRDARVNQVYGSAFFQGKRLIEDAALQLPKYLEAVKKLGEKLYFVGDGVTPYRQEILTVLGGQASFAPTHLNGLKAGAAAVIAANRTDFAVPAQELLPLYLRQPQAERERMNRYG